MGKSSSKDALKDDSKAPQAPMVISSPILPYTEVKSPLSEPSKLSYQSTETKSSIPTIAEDIHIPIKRSYTGNNKGKRYALIHFDGYIEIMCRFDTMNDLFLNNRLAILDIIAGENDDMKTPLGAYFYQYSEKVGNDDSDDEKAVDFFSQPTNHEIFKELLINGNLERSSAKGTKSEGSYDILDTKDRSFRY